jgi:hypothetical protein
MDEHEFKITTQDEFLSLRGKAFWLETQFENMMQWQAYMSIKNDNYRNALFILSHDSEKHEGILLQIIANFEGVSTKTLEEHAGMQ